ncbi:MAG: LysM peptidoglycan-binding domain-containing protein, partial [Lachnospiraceae bacterium]|nr:LysM peptidoglycan-binding domain-containing protein [Lachnospiraceae bacterium]
VYIKQEVYKALEEYASSDTAHELGTIILGNYSDALGKMNVVVSEFIYAKYTDASASALTFTHETWDYVHKEHANNHPDTKIVGWQHTHPGYGIFLSNYDMFIQENFFNLPFQVAYVIDPVQHIRGFFQWKNGKVEKLKGFYIYDEVGKQIKIEQPKEKKNSGSSASIMSKTDNGSRFSVFQPIILGVLCIAVIGLLISTMSLHKRYDRQVEEQEALELQLAEQNMLISQQAMELELVKTATTPSADTQSDNQIVDNKEDESKDIEFGVTESDEPLQEPPSIDGRVYFTAYKVEAGDSLYAICSKNNLDYASAYRIILAINGIQDPNQIYVGQIILLPIKE